MKRAFDVAAASVGLVVLAPVVFACALLIRLSSKGPAIFRQARIGKDERVFTCYKLRTMLTDTAHLPTHQTASTAVTPIGKHLRRLKLDELPQLWNVLKGEMSFVGPRPERPFFVEQFAKEIPYYTQRLSAKPGITGWAQVYYPYGATVEDAVEKLRLDLYYIKNMSLILDLFIIMKTLKIIVLGKGAR